MRPILSSNHFEDRIDSVVVVPLLNDGKHLIGSSPELSVSGDDIYIVDNHNCNIFRYSASGGFMNAIGHRGRSDKEYLSVQNIQIHGDTLSVFSYPGKLTSYLKDGTYLYSRKYKSLGRQSFLAGDSMLAYFGYETGRKYRYAVLDGDTERFHALKTSGKVMMYDTSDPVFFEGNGRILMQDSYSDVIYEVSPTSCDPYVSFDFGRYSIDRAFFRSSDIFSGAELLLASDFAFINRYVENASLRMVFVLIQRPDNSEVVYGMGSNGSWSWYGMGTPMSALLSGTFKTADDECLYFLAESDHLSSVSKGLRKKMDIDSLPDDLPGIADYVVLKVYIH